MRKRSIMKICFSLLLFLFLAFALACGGGGSSGGAGTMFDQRIANYKKAYGMTDEWESWMIANKERYLDTFAVSSVRPNTITVSFQYETTPINYSPAWGDEGEHMDELATMAEGAYPGYYFNIIFEGNNDTSYANMIAGISTNTSYALGKNVYLYYETIFNHEFGHIMDLPHHYDSISDIGDGLHMPPGETLCLMDRTSTTFCSACRTALGIPLDIFDTSEMDSAMSNILSRYPY